MSIIIRCACGQCGAEFPVNPGHFTELGFSALPKACPACIDRLRNDGRGKKIITREELFFLPSLNLYYFPVELKIPERERAPDERAVFWGHWDGANLSGPGASGGVRSGSLTFYALRQFQAGDNASFRHMRVTNEITHEDRTETRTHEYVYLGSPEGEPEYYLDETTSRFKTTLKGFGRQYSEPADMLPDSTVWKREFFAGYRSGRASTRQTWFIRAVGDQSIPAERTEYPGIETITGLIRAALSV